MSNVPQVSGKEVIKVLQKIGFAKISQKGSHIKLMRMKQGRKQLVIVPNHRVVRKGTLLSGILKPIHISLEDFKKLLK